MDFVDPGCRALLSKHGLDEFDALWRLELTAVDEPNVENGGWSSVCQLELDGSRFFLKRQVNFFTRTLHRPLGETTAAREFRNIRRYQRLGIPALDAVFYGERKVAGELRAILLTRALDGWLPLLDLLPEWGRRPPDERQRIIAACADLVGRLHAARLKHGCLYTKHLFLHEQSGEWQGCLIDLEKTRRNLWGWRDTVRDIETFLRSVAIWSEEEQRLFLDRYLRVSGTPGSVELWLKRVVSRRKYKRKPNWS
ncbi:MAG: lipopolysaccharide kinase [Deltaproteobacteria bacterium]|nr:MAG: lipopolysaccharide kinase [Deltaproteobacteria bacterium]